jgi:hypothetical protein
VNAARAAVAVAALLLTGCSSGGGGGGGAGGATGDAVRNVLTLRFGAVSNAKALRGTGPFREYGVPPDRMLEVVEGVLLERTPAVWTNRRRGEVTAKEQTRGDPGDPSYADDWSSAVVVTVHPVAGDASRSRVEVHGVRRGVFERGSVDWEREVPPRLDAAVSGGALDPIRPIR